MIPDFSGWLEIKRQIVEITALERDALHIYAGIALQLGAAWLLRWRLSEWRTLIPLLAAELLNEAADLYYEIWPTVDRGLQWSASLHDVFNTLAVPVLIVLIVRRRDARSA